MTELLERALGTLPHGPEFRFVDRLLSMVPGKEGVAEYCVREDEFFLRGHLPGEPIFPGVLLIEAAAQLAGVVAQHDPEFAPVPGLRLAAVRAAKIHGSARPGEVIRLEVRITGRLGALIQAEARASVGSEPALTAEITLGA